MSDKSAVVLRTTYKNNPYTPHIVQAKVPGYRHTWWCTYGTLAVGGGSPTESYNNLMSNLK